MTYWRYSDDSGMRKVGHHGAKEKKEANINVSPAW